MENEIWVDVIDFEGHYQVSNKGRVRSLTKTVPHKNGVQINVYKGRVLKCNYRAKNGYYQVTLSKENVMYQLCIHKIVMLSFSNKSVLTYMKGLAIDHIDGNRENNNIENLEIVTIAENSRRYYKKTAKNFGISISKSGKYRTRVYYDGKSRTLGTYDCIEKARSIHSEAIRLIENNQSFSHLITSRKKIINS